MKNPKRPAGLATSFTPVRQDSKKYTANDIKIGDFVKKCFVGGNKEQDYVWVLVELKNKNGIIGTIAKSSSYSLVPIDETPHRIERPATSSGLKYGDRVEVRYEEIEDVMEKDTSEVKVRIVVPSEKEILRKIHD